MVSGGLVLLDDEHARRHAADRELLVPLYVGHLLRHRTGGGHRAQRLRQSVKRTGSALRVYAQPAVVHQADPPPQAKPASTRPNVLTKRAIRPVPLDEDAPSLRLAHLVIVGG